MKEPRLLPLLLWVAIESLMMRPAAGQLPPPNLPPPGGYQAIPNFTGFTVRNVEAVCTARCG